MEIINGSKLPLVPRLADDGQRLLAESAGWFLRIVALSSPNWGWEYRLAIEGNNEDTWIGQLSRMVKSDLYEMRKRFQSRFRTRVDTPSRVTGLHLFGVRTIAVPLDKREHLLEPYRSSGFLLAPVVAGYPTVNFKKGSRRW